MQSNLPVIGDVCSRFGLILCVVPSVHHIKRMLQISWIMRFHRSPDTGSRMAEFELHRVQPLPFQAPTFRSVADWRHTWRLRQADARWMRNARESDACARFQGSRKTSVASPKRSITSQWVMAFFAGGVTQKRKSELWHVRSALRSWPCFLEMLARAHDRF